MRNKVFIAALGLAVTAPIAHADVDLMGKVVQVYGKLHVSLDSYDRGAETAAVPDPSGVEVTSNSSRIGFKGETDLEQGPTAVWRFESEIDVTGESGTLAARSRYLGLKGGFGQIIVGIHDTPFKDTAGAWDMFGDTVGDRRGILGQTSSADNQFNQRAKNMLEYSLKAGDFEGRLMYAPDFEDVMDPDSSPEPTATTPTTTSQSLLSAGLAFKIAGLKLSAAYEDQKAIDGVDGRDASGIRAAAIFGIGDLRVGALYEQLKDDGYGTRMDRNAYGANISYAFGPVTVAGQYMAADESEAQNDGASEIAAGVFYKMAKSTQIYAMYGALDNDPNARYRLARSGHGQAYAPTVAGESVSAVSLGLSHSF